MTVECRNHEGVPATCTANMTLAVPPYRQDVPLCAECGPRIQRIGFAVTLTPIADEGSPRAAR